MRRSTRRWKQLTALGLALALVAASCGGDDGGGTSGTTAADDASGAVGNVEDVDAAVVRIVARGSFAVPDELLQAVEISNEKSGSGFIVDPQGLVVTNNHVVTGAASLEVYVEGEDDPVNARVLGVSECNDLAVIDLDGDGYEYLTWQGEAPSVGQDVRAAGYPLGDPEFTLTTGIVSKARADGDWDWASVPFTIEHDANIQPGNSGGPLLDAETARVVAVNYAGDDPAGVGTEQFFGIASDQAAEVVETLREGEDVLSLGVNGLALFADVQGIWVAGVASGSPAFEIGIEPGDLIERVEGLPVGSNGTMRDYCDILRSHDPDDVLTVQVLRVNEGLRLRGAFNGDELEPYESLVEDVEEQTGGSLEAGESYTYETVTDDTGILVVEVPTAWSDRQTSTVEVGDALLPQIIAAASVAGYLDTYDTPGMSFIVDDTGGTTVEDFLATSQFSGDCVSQGVEPYDDGLYAGQIEFWTDCGPNATAIVVIAAAPPGNEFTVRVVVQMVTEADGEALDRIIQSFRVAG